MHSSKEPTTTIKSVAIRGDVDGDKPTMDAESIKIKRKMYGAHPLVDQALKFYEKHKAKYGERRIVNKLATDILENKKETVQGGCLQRVRPSIMRRLKLLDRNSVIATSKTVGPVPLVQVLHYLADTSAPWNQESRIPPRETMLTTVMTESAAAGLRDLAQQLTDDDTDFRAVQYGLHNRYKAKNEMVLKAMAIDDELCMRAFVHKHKPIFNEVCRQLRFYNSKLDCLLELTKTVLLADDPGLEDDFIGGTYLTSIFFNFNSRTRLHSDEHDLFSVILPFGDFEGGELVLPSLARFVDIRPGNAIFLRSSIMVHGNAGVSQGTRDAIVLYYHRQICRRAYRILLNNEKVRGVTGSSAEAYNETYFAVTAARIVL